MTDNLVKEEPVNKKEDLWPIGTEFTYSYPPDKRRRDLDNLLRACKPFWDGMVDAGLLKDDSCIREISVKMAPPDKANPRVEIELREV